jgi:hypothetical protein
MYLLLAMVKWPKKDKKDKTAWAFAPRTKDILKNLTMNNLKSTNQKVTKLSQSKPNQTYEQLANSRFQDMALKTSIQTPNPQSKINPQGSALLFPNRPKV